MFTKQELTLLPKDVAAIIELLGDLKSQLKPGEEEDKVVKGRDDPVGTSMI
jgi:hypothetical protein